MNISDIKVSKWVWDYEKEFSVDYNWTTLLFYWTPRVSGKTPMLDISIDMDTYKFLTWKELYRRSILSYGPFNSMKSVKEAIINYINKNLSI